MKDRYIEQVVMSLRDKVCDLERRVEEQSEDKRIIDKYCPKCERHTLMKTLVRYDPNHIMLDWDPTPQWYCYACGSMWEMGLKEKNKKEWGNQ